MMKRTFTLLLLLSSLVGFSQDFFQRTYTDSVSYTELENMIQTADGGYIAAGYIQLPNSNGDILITRTDKDGEVLWANVYGTDSLDVAASVKALPNNKFVIAGYTYAGINDSTYNEAMIMVVNGQGDLQWVKTLGGVDYDEFAAVHVDADAGIYAVGNTSSYGNSLESSYIAKFDTLGNVQWTSVIWMDLLQSFQCVTKTSDGGFAAAGQVFKNGPGSFDPFVVKFDVDGNVLWGKKFPLPGTQIIYSIAETKDEGLAIAGVGPNATGTGRPDIIIGKLDNAGELAWMKSYGTDKYERAQSIAIGEDSSITITGYINVDSVTQLDNGIGLSVDQQGNLLWAKTYGDVAAPTRASTIVAHNVSGYTIGGSTFSYGNNNGGALLLHIENDGWVSNCIGEDIGILAGNLVTDDSGTVNTTIGGMLNDIEVGQVSLNLGTTLHCVSPYTSLIEQLADIEVALYPNPASGTIHLMLSSPEKVKQITILDMQGRAINSYSSSSGIVRTFDINRLSAGIYFMQLKTVSGQVVKRFIVE